MGVDRKTARKYILTTSPPRYERAGRGSKLDPFKDYIRSELEKNPYSAPKMMRKIREKGYAGGISILKDFMLPIKDASRVVAEIRFETEPGEQSQVDWIDFGIREVDGARVHLFAFVMVLGWSRMRFVRFTTHARIRSGSPQTTCRRNLTRSATVSASHLVAPTALDMASSSTVARMPPWIMPRKPSHAGVGVQSAVAPPSGSAL